MPACSGLSPPAPVLASPGSCEGSGLAQTLPRSQTEVLPLPPPQASQLDSLRPVSERPRTWARSSSGGGYKEPGVGAQGSSALPRLPSCTPVGSALLCAGGGAVWGPQVQESHPGVSSSQS